MLSSIDQRLSKLEGVIIPIHAETQKLTKVEERNSNVVSHRRSQSNEEHCGECNFTL